MLVKMRQHDFLLSFYHHHQINNIEENQIFTKSSKNKEDDKISK